MGREPLIQECPAGISLQGSKDELLLLVVPQYKLHAGIAQIAQPIEENDFFIAGYIQVLA